MKESTFEKYKLVIDEYLVNGMNGTKAYQKFYPKSSDEASANSFKEILRIPDVDQYYKGRQKDAQNTLKITHQDVLKELYNWAYSDITQTISLTPYEVENLPIEVRRLITKFKKTTRRIGEEMTEETIELHFVSKEKAIEMINKHIGFYEADNAQKNETTIVQFELPLNNRESSV